MVLSAESTLEIIEFAIFSVRHSIPLSNRQDSIIPHSRNGDGLVHGGHCETGLQSGPRPLILRTRAGCNLRTKTSFGRSD